MSSEREYEEDSAGTEADRDGRSTRRISRE